MNISGYSTNNAVNQGQRIAAMTPQITTGANLNQAFNRSESSAPQIAAGVGQNNAANQYQDLLGQLIMSALNGQGPSLAQQQLDQSQDKNLKQMLGSIGAMGGVNSGAMRNNILRQGGQNMADLAGQGAILRAQEFAQNQNLLSGLSQQLQQNNQFNASNALSRAGTNLQSQGNYFQTILNALQSGQAQNQSAYLNAFGQGTGLAQQEANNNLNNFKAGTGAAMGLFSLMAGGA